MVKPLEDSAFYHDFDKNFVFLLLIDRTRLLTRTFCLPICIIELKRIVTKKRLL